MTKPTGIFRPLGLALLLALGFGSIYMFLAVWGYAVWLSQCTQNEVQQIWVVGDGTPYVELNTTERGTFTRSYRTLDGTAVEKPKEGFLVGASLPMHRHDESAPSLEGSARIRLFSDGQLPLNHWYFIHDGEKDGRGYFVGYNSETKIRLGFIGRGGFRTEEPPAEQWFPVDGTMFSTGGAYSYNNYTIPGWQVLMIAGDQLIAVDLRVRTVTTLMQSADLIAIGVLSPGSRSKMDREVMAFSDKDFLAVRTEDRVIVLDRTGKQIAEYLLPEALRNQSILFYAIDAKKALIEVRRMLPDGTSWSAEFSWIDSGGNVTRREKVLMSGLGSLDATLQGRLMILFAPSPIVISLITLFAPLNEMDDGSTPGYTARLAYIVAVFWPPLLVLTLVSAALAAYCYRRHRRFGQPYDKVWFAFVLLLGLPGLVGYLFHRRRPVLEKCPACGKDAPRDRDACAKCGATFPLPERTGCEVFA